MSKLLRKLAVGGMILTGIGLAGHAFFQEDGEMDKKDVIEYATGLGLIAGRMAYSSYSPKNAYKAK